MDLTKWFGKNQAKENKPRGRAAISLQHDGIALAHCLFDDAQPHVQFCEFYPNSGDATANQLTWLMEIVASHQLNGVACSWVLNPSDYKLFMLEAPQVPESERNMAVRWQIKEFIDFSLDDAVIDTCLIPEFGSEHRHMLYAAVARESQLRQRLKLLQSSGLALDTVDVVELALRNLAGLFVKGDDSILIVQLEKTHSQLAVCRNKQLYFSRQLTVNFDKLDDEYMQSQSSDYVPEAFDELVTNIQRSLDFFESQMAQPVPNSIIIMPLPFRSTLLQTYLDEHLTQTVKIADLNDVLNTKQELMLEVQTKCFTVLGGLLCEEINHYATTN